MSGYYAVVTDSGTKKMMQAVKEGKKVNITSFAAGDGNGEYCTPDRSAKQLVHEVWRGYVNSCRISEESENLLIIEAVMPSDVGGFTIREMCVFDDEGDMIAVCNTPETQKVRVTDGVVHELRLEMEIAVSNTDSVQLIVDPTVVMATKKELEQLNRKIESLEAKLTQGKVLLTDKTTKLIYEIGIDNGEVFIALSEDNPAMVVLETQELESTDTVAITVDNTTYGVQNATTDTSADVPDGTVVFNV